jgi:hypothetical protein
MAIIMLYVVFCNKSDLMSHTTAVKNVAVLEGACHAIGRIYTDPGNQVKASCAP